MQLRTSSQVAAGTGKWEWYARVSHCGDAGTFSGGGHIYVGGGSGDFNWYLASCTCIDVTESHQLFNRQFIADMDMRAPHYYDLDNTAYYTNPASTSHMNAIYLADGLYHKDDSDTSIVFTPNEIDIDVGGIKALHADSSVLTINSNNANYDFKVKADNGDTLLHTDASANNVILGERVKINPGTSDYTSHSNVDQYILSLQDDYNTAGSHNFHFVNHNGNWIDGTSGGDTAYGLMWGYENSIRAGIHYDHRGAEKFDFYSTHGEFRFRTPASANGNISPIGSESSMPSRLTIAMGGAVTIPHSVRSDIFYDNANTNYYVNPADTTQSAKFRQHVSIGDGGNTANSGSWGARLNLTDSVHSKIEVGQDSDSINSHWYAHTGQDAIKFGTSTAHDVEFQRGGATKLELTSDAITFNGPINMNGNNIRRGNHHTGHLEGSYNNIGGNGSKSNPIYTIGSSYNPSDAALGSMYGIGFADTGSSPTFLPGSFSGGWGMYVASSGNARVYLGGGTGDGNFLGNVKANAFYDINDTNYYVHPADTSILNTVHFATPSNTPINVFTGNNSLVVQNTGSTSAGGLVLRASGGTHLLQMYGDGSGYGFLTAAWGSWDLQKVVGGKQYYNNNQNYWVNPVADSKFNQVNVNGGITPINNGGGQLKISSVSNGTATMNAVVNTVVIAPASTRTATANHYYGGIAWGGLYNYQNGTGYDNAAQVWIGSKYQDFPGSERSKFVVGVKSGTGTTNSGNDIPVERFSIDYLGSVMASGDFRAPRFYDSNDTAKYMDPASTSQVNAITSTRLDTSTIYSGEVYNSGWFRNSSNNAGLYNSNTGQHFSSSTANYWDITSSASAQGLRLRTAGHPGTVRGYFYATSANDVGFLDNTGNWKVRVVAADYVQFDGSSARARLFYDLDNTNYYVNPASISKLNELSAAGHAVNYATSEDWVVAGQQNQTGRYGGDFGVNGDGNSVSWDEAPNIGNNPGRGKIWKTRNNDSESGADGGWNKEITGLDVNKAYMSVVYVRRASSSTNGSFYHGCRGSSTDTLNLSGSGNSNPYFSSFGIGTLDVNEWYVSVGIIQAANDSNTSNWTIGGLWKLETGARQVGYTTYKMGASGAGVQTHRTYLYYSTDSAAALDWYAPGFYEINGSEPSIEELMGRPKDSVDRLTVADDMRAPIYYDSDATSYYLDAASSSILSTATIGGVQIGGAAGYASYPRIRAGSQNIFIDPADGNTVYIGWYSGNSHTYSEGTANFQSYRDRSDSAYYADPAGTSNLNGVNAVALALTGSYTHLGHVVQNASDHWLRTLGATGIYFSSYGGGVYQTDSTYVRIYNGKALQVDNTTGIRSSGNITAYYSDERLKTKTGKIENALEKVQSLSGFTYVENELARSLGYENENEQVALSAQDVQKVMPQAVSLAPCERIERVD